MEDYIFLEHTSEAKFQAFGANLEHAFANAAKALTALLVDPDTVQPAQRHTIQVSTTDKKALLYDFLQELIVFLDAKNFVMHSVVDISIKHAGEKWFCEASVVGDDAEAYQITGHLKSMTYMEMEIEEKPGQVMVQVVVDI